MEISTKMGLELMLHWTIEYEDYVYYALSQFCLTVMYNHNLHEIPKRSKLSN